MQTGTTNPKTKRKENDKVQGHNTTRSPTKDAQRNLLTLIRASPQLMYNQWLKCVCSTVCFTTIIKATEQIFISMKRLFCIWHFLRDWTELHSLLEIPLPDREVSLLTSAKEVLFSSAFRLLALFRKTTGRIISSSFKISIDLSKTNLFILIKKIGNAKGTHIYQCV